MDDKNIIVAPSGRKYYRHYSGMGSVMCWHDGDIYRETLILDMKYHNVRKAWGRYNDNVNDIVNYTTAPFTNLWNNYYILGTFDSMPSDYDGQTDDVLNAKFNWIDEHTSKQNTDALIAQYPDGDYAANFCRSILVDGVGCDLPNMQTLVRIFCDRATIHSLDKSDTNNRWSDWFYSNVAWSSSEDSSNLAWFVVLDGGADSYDKDCKFHVVPTLVIV